MSPFGHRHQRTVTASIETVMLESTNHYGETMEVPSVQATCSQCDHQTESYGTGGDSRRRCLALLRDECPMGERNWYEDEDGDD
jgi:hypothetical protein